MLSNRILFKFGRASRDVCCALRAPRAPIQIISKFVHTGSWEVADETIYSQDHEQLKNSLNKIIENDINPFVDAWEEEQMFPAH
uniref:Uncharacterized protein n=1 Tax=Ciona intestinalis TaxID=7719 RepID=H2XS64_CIOIN